MSMYMIYTLNVKCWLENLSANHMVDMECSFDDGREIANFDRTIKLLILIWDKFPFLGYSISYLSFNCCHLFFSLYGLQPYHTLVMYMHV